MAVQERDWIKFFPFKEPRKEQVEAINFILNSFSEGHKVVIAELGTGLGKSAIALTVAKFRQAFHGSSAWYLTTQKTLQNQYVCDFAHLGMKSIRSSSNYECQMACSRSLSCAETSRLIKSHSAFKIIYQPCVQNCNYRNEKETFLQSNDSVTNYSYFFAETMYAKALQPRELLICDECHTIEDSLSNFVEISISEKFARTRLGVKKFAQDDSLTNVVAWVQKQYRNALSKRKKKLQTVVDEACAGGATLDLSKHAKELELIDKHLCKVNRFIDEFQESNWVLNVDSEDNAKRWVFKPVDVSSFAESKIFSYGDHVLLMSATILNVQSYARTLGLKSSDYRFISIKSPFPAENRAVHFVPVGSMSKKMIDSSLPSLVQAVKLLLDEHPNVKGIIHCSTFKIANYLNSNVRSKRLLVHDSASKQNVLDYHFTSTEPTVLLSPSMEEGVDLSNDLSRFQIICKVPFPYLGDEVIRKRMQKDPDWYACETLRAMIQSLGRSIRNENDYAISYILDSDWKMFVRRYSHLVPDELNVT